MILFDLLCSQNHRFEAWFRDGESFDRLAAIGEIRCALCGDTDIRKALMAPNISPSRAVESRATAEQTEDTPAPAGEDGGPTPPAAAADSPPAVMAVQDNQTSPGDSDGLPVPEKVAKAMRLLRQVQTHIEQNFDHVGERFAEEARKMHYGEAEKRSIYGEATKHEAEELAEEGIDVNQMPWLTPRNG